MQFVGVPSMVTKEQALKYYQDKKKYEKVILSNLKKKKHIVHGARGINAHLPPYLDRPTEDWDIFAKTPKKTATMVEKKLDKKYGGDFFDVEKGVHEGTFRLKSNVTERVVADYTKPDKKIPFKTKKGVRYATLGYFKHHIKKTLKDPDAKFRHAKDREALQRIEIHEVEKRRRKKRKPKTLMKGVKFVTNLHKIIKR